MSLMGYERKEIQLMRQAIGQAYDLIDSPQIEAGLTLALDLLEGLLEEGRV